MNRVLGWRPGLPLVVLGGSSALLGFTSATWFSPSNYNATLTDTRDAVRRHRPGRHRGAVPGLAGLDVLFAVSRGRRGRRSLPAEPPCSAGRRGARRDRSCFSP